MRSKRSLSLIIALSMILAVFAPLANVAAADKVTEAEEVRVLISKFAKATKIGDIDQDHIDKVNAAADAYEGLSKEGKEELAKMNDGYHVDKLSGAKVDVAHRLISKVGLKSLGRNTVEKELADKIEAALAAVAKLSPTEYEVLAARNNGYHVDKLETAEVDLVHRYISLFSVNEELSEEYEAKVNKAKAAYDKLSPEQKDKLAAKNKGYHVKKLEEAVKRIEEDEEVVNKEALEEAIAKAKGLQEEDYTEETWAAFLEALEAAEAVAADEDATQEDVDNALAALEEAVEGLEEKEDELKVVEVSAINSTQAEVKFNMEVKEVKPANFKVTDKDGNLVFVSKVELNEAKDVATLTFFDKFADKATYNVEVSNVADVDGNVMEKDTAKFEYVKADVAKVEFTQTTVAPEAKLIDFIKVTDKLGRDVTGEVEVKFESSNTDVISAAGVAGNKEIADGKSAIVVAKVGDVKTAATTIKVKDAVATEFAGYYVYKSESPVANTDTFEKLKEEEKVNYVYMKDKDDNAKKVALYYKDQYGKSMPAVKEKLEVKNMTPAIVIVEADGKIKPISAGEGYVKVKNGDIETTIKIVVREDVEVATMKLEKTEVSVIKGKQDTIKVEYKDQYGQETTAGNKVLKAEVKDDKIATVTASENGNTLTVKGLAKGETTAEVSYKVNDKLTLKETIKVVVEEAGDLETYKAEVEATKLDVANNENKDEDKAPKTTTIKVYAIDENGNKLGNAENVKFEAVDKDGKADSSIVFVGETDGKVEAKKEGTGYVKVTVGTLTVDTIEFEVVDTTEKATSVDFKRQDIVFEDVVVDESGKVAESGLDIIAKIKENISILNQNGEVMEGQDPEIAIEATNEKDLKVEENKVTELKALEGTADIVITSIKVDNNELITGDKPVMKVAAKAKKEQTGSATATANLSKFDDENVYYGNVGVKLTLPKNIDFENVDSLVIEILNGDNVLATNTLIKKQTGNSIDSPFLIGQKGNTDYAWDRGVYPVAERTPNNDELPNKVVATYVINGITYVSESLVSVSLPTEN